MKTFILCLIFILFSLFAFSDEGEVNYFEKRIMGIRSDNTVAFGTVCIDGFKFAFMKAQGNNGVALAQIFQTDYPLSHPPKPVECKK